MDEFRSILRDEIQNDFYMENMKLVYVFSWDKDVVRALDGLTQKDINKLFKSIPRKRHILHKKELIQIIRHALPNRNNNI